MPVLQTGGLTLIYASAMAMGASMFVAPASMAVLARQFLPAQAWGKALMFYSLVFSLGQALGSWAFGHAADSHSLSWILGAASGGLLLSALFALAGVGKRYQR
jgi:hypothetical protein